MAPPVAMLPVVAASVDVTAAAESRGVTPTAVAVAVESADAFFSVLHAPTRAARTTAVLRKVLVMRSPVRGVVRASARGGDRCTRVPAVRAAPSHPERAA